MIKDERQQRLGDAEQVLTNAWNVHLDKSLIGDGLFPRANPMEDLAISLVTSLEMVAHIRGPNQDT